MSIGEPVRAVRDGVAPLRLGFVRGTAPGKWAKRWEQSVGAPLELVPIEAAFVRDELAAETGNPGAAPGIDVLLERTLPGATPRNASGPGRARHALRLYEEAVAVVLPAEHPLADAPSIAVDELALVALLDHPDHAEEWPAARPWDDPEWMPADASAALELVATGVGAILLPLPLARHLASKREHAVLPVTGEPAPAGTVIWASWEVDRDDADVQQLVGIMRGRTARSSRPAAPRVAGDGRDSERSGGGSETQRTARTQRGSQAPRKPLKPNSRGAQLAAAREKAEREKAERKRAAKERRARRR
ncbi:LysR substrate-binding domain-containing protein [Leucobacter sp. wl10]|uniref:LysR substrate-binding domain-containing protein n=1 Tax=Leucobacter sp. wl10 TaxID=2304677 RepID=UPI000E5C460A|nr:LysR substrate-binding domain-containing protein [Leucobacter sp. wl10]RGE18773.1 LysR family transcriptional regulator [Leucobacter sp. wl10]